MAIVASAEASVEAAQGRIAGARKRHVELVSNAAAMGAPVPAGEMRQARLAAADAVDEVTAAQRLIGPQKRKGLVPRRVEVPAMPMQERLQLAGAIVERRGKRLADLPDLTPLLRFTRGNPLTILVTLREALRAGIDTLARLDAFVAALHRGEVAFEDEASEGRSKSLGASLSYGLGAAFTDDERKILALLHLFQGIVDVQVLGAMGAPEAEWCLAAVRGLTSERGIALLSRAAEIGLLQPHGGGYYGIHRALPWRDSLPPHERRPATTAGRCGLDRLGIGICVRHSCDGMCSSLGRLVRPCSASKSRRVRPQLADFISEWVRPRGETARDPGWSKRP